MSALTERLPTKRPVRNGLLTAACLAVLVAMALDTKVVREGDAAAAREEGFSPERFGEERFPEIKSFVEERAVPAPRLADALAEDQSAAGEEFGVPAGIGPILPVTVTGTAAEVKSGITTLDVDGLSDELTVRVQTGPAINGTVLRDATGEIKFGQFKNQIEYQNAGAALNDAMKAQALADLDRDALVGKTVSVTGAFQLINPKAWLITPVSLSVE